MAFYPRLLPCQGAGESSTPLRLWKCDPNTAQERDFLECFVWIAYGFSME